MKEAEKKILRTTKMKFQDEDKMESCRPCRMEEEVQDRDEMMENLGTGKWRRSTETQREHELVHEERAQVSQVSRGRSQHCAREKRMKQREQQRET